MYGVMWGQRVIFTTNPNIFVVDLTSAQVFWGFKKITENFMLNDFYPQFTHFEWNIFLHMCVCRAGLMF